MSTVKLDKVFALWKDNLIPANVTRDKDTDKKKAIPSKWKNGETYSLKELGSKNSIALRTGSITANLIDIDTKDINQLIEPWQTWVEDRLMFEDTLTVESTNGYHFYVNTGDFKMKTTSKSGADKSTVPFIDFRGEGGMAFIASSSKGIDYEVLCDAPPMLLEKEMIALLPQYNPPKKETDQDLTDDDLAFMNLVKEEEGYTYDEVLNMLMIANIPYSNRDDFRAFGSSAYNLLKPSEKGRIDELITKWVTDQYGEYLDKAGWVQVAHLIKELENGSFGSKYEGGMLINASKEGGTEYKFDHYMKLISECTDVRQIKDLFAEDSEWHDTPLCTEGQQKIIYSECKKHGNKLLKDNNRAATLTVKDFKDLVVVEEKVEVDEDILATTEVYINNGKYVIVKDKKIVHVNIGGIKAYLPSLSLSDKMFAQMNKEFPPPLISGVLEESDYLSKTHCDFKIKTSSDIGEYPYLGKVINPLYAEVDYIHDEAVIEDFCENIWCGKARDIIKMVGLSIRFKETKLNKVMIVAPSNSGKTRFAKHAGFSEVTMNLLLEGLVSSRGIGEAVINKIRGSGLLLIDETNRQLPQEIKALDDYIYLNQFGMGGGTKEVKLHYTLMTSTHKGALANLSDEMVNRILVVELHENEMEYGVTKSPLFIKDKEHYSNVLEGYFRAYLREVLHDDTLTQTDLTALHDTYALDIINDLDELLLDVSEKVIEMIHTGVSAGNEDYIEVQGKLHIKRKTDVSNLIAETLSHHGEIDIPKYTEKMMSHFFKSPRKSVKRHGKPVKYYPMENKKYYLSEEQEVLSLFDELDDIQDEFTN